MQDYLESISNSYTTVFSTKNGSVFQCDAENCWYIDFAGKVKRFDYRCLLKLKLKVYQFNIYEKLIAQKTCADIEIISICACDHCYVLSYLQIIALKELLQGTFAMLELNHIIYDKLYRVVA